MRQGASPGEEGPSEAILPWVCLQESCTHQEPLLIAYFQWWPKQLHPSVTNGLPDVAPTRNGPIRTLGLLCESLDSRTQKECLSPPAHWPLEQESPSATTKDVPQLPRTPAVTELTT